MGISKFQKKINFTTLDETTLAEDINDSCTKIEGLTEADVQAIERLVFPRYDICSKKRLKERWGHNDSLTISQILLRL